MLFSDLFNVFSRRPATQPARPKPLTESFRNRIFMRCRDLFGNGQTFWTEIHLKLAYLHGRLRLSNTDSHSELEDVLQFLENCADTHFLDFLEYIFRTQAYFHASNRANLVDDINEFFRQDDLPYALTDFVYTKGIETQFGQEYSTITLTGYPQVIRKDSEVLDRGAIQPTLQLLREPDFMAANKEFLEALEDFRKADYGDCLTKCGSAFESVLKVICARKKWPHNPTDTASPLLKTVISKSGLESFFEQPLILVATLRNKLSKSHGAGQEARDVTEAKAEYTINATAAAILLLVKEAG
ncbi:MAG: hypothetical protein MCM46_02570 [Candidatus Manganitrophus sp. SB1]|nr:hypothetical protein [Candidatus Manganitrophus morganii]